MGGCNRSSYSKIDHGNTNLIRLWPTQGCVRSVSTFQTEICSFFTEWRGKLKLQAVVIQKHSSCLIFARSGIAPYLGSYVWLLIYNIKEVQDSVRAYLCLFYIYVKPGDFNQKAVQQYFNLTKVCLTLQYNSIVAIPSPTLPSTLSSDLKHFQFVLVLCNEKWPVSCDGRRKRLMQAAHINHERRQKCDRLQFWNFAFGWSCLCCCLTVSTESGRKSFHFPSQRYPTNICGMRSKRKCTKFLSLSLVHYWLTNKEPQQQVKET